MNPLKVVPLAFRDWAFEQDFETGTSEMSQMNGTTMRDQIQRCPLSRENHSQGPYGTITLRERG